MADKNKNGKKSSAVAERATEPPAFDERDDRSPETASALAIPSAGAQLAAQAEDPNAEPATFDPGGDIQTKVDDVVGREIVITRWSLNPSSEQYATGNTLGMFAVLGFRLADDQERKPRFLTIGAQRVVESVHKAILDGQKLPLRATIVAFQARGGTGYRFLRPGEKAH